MADAADRHVYYEKAVQCVESEIDFVDATFTRLRKRKAEKLREDFCGTTNTSCEWVKRRKTNIAYCVDLDEEVLEWGRNNSPERHDHGFTHCFMVTFDSEDGRQAYLPHPDHMAFVEVLKPVLDKVRVLDFWSEK